MSDVWIENGPASRRTLILCLILGLSVAAHRAVVGFKPLSAIAGGQLASGLDAVTGPSIPPSVTVPAVPVSPAPAAAPPGGASRPTEKREPRMNPYARRLWALDPFRAPNVLQLAGTGFPVPENTRPLLDERQTREVLARTTVEHSVTPDGATRVSITMPGAAPDPAPVPAPDERSHVALESPREPRTIAPGRTRGKPRAVVSTSLDPLAPCIFAFAGYDLTREEGRRWTLALAFEGRDH